MGEMAEDTMCLKCFDGHPESDRKKYSKFHFYKQKAAKKRPNAHRGNPSADTIITPMAEDDSKLDLLLERYKDYVLGSQNIYFTGSKLALDKKETKAAINAYTTNKIIEAMGLTETNRYDLLSKQQQKQLIEYHKSCLETLEEALNHRKENHA